MLTAEWPKKTDSKEAALELLEQYFPEVFGEGAVNDINFLFRQAKKVALSSQRAPFPEDIVSASAENPTGLVKKVALRYYFASDERWKFNVMLTFFENRNLFLSWSGAAYAPADTVYGDFVDCFKKFRVDIRKREMAVADYSTRLSDAATIELKKPNFKELLATFQGGDRVKVHDFAAVPGGVAATIKYTGFPLKASLTASIVPFIFTPR